MRSIDNLLKEADEQLTGTGIVHKEEKTIDKSNVTAIVGFGAMVINIGLDATLAVYRDKNPDVFQALQALTKSNPGDNLIPDGISLHQRRAQVKRFTDASVALKIMARTYKIIKKD